MNSLIDDRKQNWQVIKEQADLIKKAGLLPSTMTPEMAVIIILKGQELGVGPMRALEGMFVISGKVAMQASFVMGLIRERCPGAKFTTKRKDDKGCIIEATRPGQQTETFHFLEKDAQTAGLLAKGPWKQYPKSMYWARVVTLIGRQLFSDILGGASYTPEELGGEVNEDSELDAGFSVSKPIEIGSVTEANAMPLELNQAPPHDDIPNFEDFDNFTGTFKDPNSPEPEPAEPPQAAVMVQKVIAPHECQWLQSRFKGKENEQYCSVCKKKRKKTA